MAKSDIDAVGIKLELLDLLVPYGVTGAELTPFTEDTLAILELPSQERDKALSELADKIKNYYRKTKRV